MCEHRLFFVFFYLPPCFFLGVCICVFVLINVCLCKLFYFCVCLCICVHPSDLLLRAQGPYVPVTRETPLIGRATVSESRIMNQSSVKHNSGAVRSLRLGVFNQTLHLTNNNPVHVAVVLYCTYLVTTE